MSATYTAEHLETLASADAIRRAAHLYVKPTTRRAAQDLLFEILSNSVDEALSGHCSEIRVTRHADESLTVEDNGRGIPIEEVRPGLRGPELVLTTLYCGGKYTSKAYSVSGGRFGMGAAVVNALSDRLEVDVRRDGQRYRQWFVHGHAAGPPEITFDRDAATGTRIHFRLDAELLRHIAVDTSIVKTRIWELGCLVPGTKMTFTDEATTETEEHLNATFAQSTERFLQYCFINRGFSLAHPIHLSTTIDGIRVEVGIQIFSDFFDKNFFSYVNGIRTIRGGVHVAALTDALCDALTDAVHRDVNPTLRLAPDVVLEGIGALISVYLSQPEFVTTEKHELGGEAVRQSLYMGLHEALVRFFAAHPDVERFLVEKVTAAQSVRETVRRVGEMTFRGHK